MTNATTSRSSSALSTLTTSELSRSSSALPQIAETPAHVSELTEPEPSHPSEDVPTDDFGAAKRSRIPDRSSKAKPLPTLADVQQGSVVLSRKTQSRGPAVEQVRQQLQELGYPSTDGSDAEYGPSLETAVRRFQRDRGIAPASGEVNKRTLTSMQQALSQKSARTTQPQVSSAAAPPPPPTSQPAAPSSTPPPAISSVAMAPAAPPVQHTLRQVLDGAGTLSRNGQSQGAAVTEARAQLAALGYPSTDTPPDAFGSSMESAVRRFQQEQGIFPATGELDSKTFGAVGSRLFERARKGEYVIKQGETGMHVRKMQEYMTRAGSAYGVQATGEFGPTTLAQVKKFQKAKGLAADGLVGKNTLTALGVPATEAPAFNQLRGVLDGNVTLSRQNQSQGAAVDEARSQLAALGYASSDTPPGSYGASMESAVQKFQQDQGISPATGEIDKDTFGAMGTRLFERARKGEYVIKQGETGMHVRKMQEFLSRAGPEFAVQPTGEFGPTTVAQVKKYQAAKGLDADGLVGKITLTALGVPATPEGPASTLRAVLDGTSTLSKLGESKGPAVAETRAQLAALGYASSDASADVFGDSLEGAVTRFQQDAGISPANGVVDSKTLGAAGTRLFELARKGEYVIQPGETGMHVRLMQEMLKKAGPNYSVDATGEYGPTTQSMIQKLQSSEGLGADGKVGRDTFAALGMQVARECGRTLVNRLDLNRLDATRPKQAELKEAIEAAGGKWNADPNAVNMLAVRKPTNSRANYNGKYDDWTFLSYKGKVYVLECNTDPSGQYMDRYGRKPMGDDVNGDGRLDQGWRPEGYNEYYRGYSETLGNVLKPAKAMSMYRDVNADGKIDENERKYYRSSDGYSVFLHAGSNSNTYSAGCQTFPPDNFGLLWSLTGQCSNRSSVGYTLVEPR